MKLDKRKRRILATIIEEYISTARPISSELIAHIFNDEISPATIRNEMALLYELGLLEQPYTSSGRVPSLNGYRLYADDIMEQKELDASVKDEIEYLLNLEFGVNNILKKAAQILADVSKCAAIFTTIYSEINKIEKINLIPTASNLCIVAISTTYGCDKNKICNLGCTISELFLESLCIFLNNSFVAKSPAEVTQKFVKSLIMTFDDGNEESVLNSMYIPVLLCIYDMCCELCHVDLFIKGSTNLLNYSELSNDVSSILSFIEEHSEVKKLITAEVGEIKIQIGQNIANSELKPFSILDICYKVKEKGKGRIALIGPVRINYRLCTTYLKYFADILPKFIN